MPALSKTGLVPSVPKKISFEIQPKTTLDISNIAVPAPYVLRPFAGICNPFPNGCSVLCNHPADLEAKNVVKRAKHIWAVEGRGILKCDDLKIVKCQRFHRSYERGSIALGDVGVTVPEELFRRYTDTDSRPLTPAPTVVSVTTRHSQYMRSRRCMTPDPGFSGKERMLLVLDLRRSHSQETITWIGSQQEESIIKLQTATSRTTSSVSKATSLSSKKKKPVKTPSGPQSAKTDTDKENRSSGKSFDAKSLLSPEQALDHKKQPPSSSGENSEPDVVKRRGKRKKGKKLGNAKDGEKEFQGFPEPGETQVSALGNESRMGSTRPSLTATTGLLGDAAETDHQSGDVAGKSSKASFLDQDILKQLQRQLDNEVVESELDMKRKIALEEALRLIPKVKPSKQNQEIKALKKEFASSVANPEKWLSLPRVFTRQSARFELPMDSRSLNDMTPLQYAERYVFPSEERLVLYNHVFNLHREEFDEDEDENVERILLGKNVIRALGDIMGRPMTDEEANDFQKLIGWTNDMTLDFRMFTGISAVCERLLAHKFCSKMPTPNEDLKHEVERADFESLDRKLQYVKPEERMVRILKAIRDL